MLNRPIGVQVMKNEFLTKRRGSSDGKEPRSQWCECNSTWGHSVFRMDVDGVFSRIQAIGGHSGVKINGVHDFYQNRDW